MAAIRAAQLGLRTAVVEHSDLGGICLNLGCIPTKALIQNASVVNLVKQAGDYGVSCENLTYSYGPAYERSRRVVKRLVTGVGSLMKKNRIDVIKGSGSLAGAGKVKVSDGTQLGAKNVIVATGARPRSVPGITMDGERVLSYREAVVLKDVPSSMLIIGAGPIGMEFGYVFHSYDCAVTIVEMLPRALPLEEPEISELVQKQFSKQGIQVRTESRVTGLESTPEGVRARIAGPKGEEELTVEKVLVAIGIQANVENIGLEEAGVAMERGCIKIDDQMRTNVPGIYAVGDVTGKMALAHVASAQGEIAAEVIAGHEPAPLVYHDMPRAVYCHPQVASLGLTEAQARERGYDVRVGSFPFRANGKALGLNDWEGYVKIIVDARYGELLGASLVGPEVTELLPELGVTRTLEGTAEDIGRTVHAHPTLSEAVREAALAALGKAIHI